MTARRSMRPPPPPLLYVCLRARLLLLLLLLWLHYYSVHFTTVCTLLQRALYSLYWLHDQASLHARFPCMLDTKHLLAAWCAT